MAIIEGKAVAGHAGGFCTRSYDPGSLILALEAVAAVASPLA